MYVSAEEKKHLETEADEAGETLSSYCYKLMQAQREREGLDKAATDLNAEERMLRLLADGEERLEEIAEEIKDINARAGAYSVANFELLKQDYPDAKRRDVLETGARRLRYPLEEHADLSDQGETDTAQNEPQEPQSTETEDTDDDSDRDGGSKGVDDLI